VIAFVTMGRSFRQKRVLLKSPFAALIHALPVRGSSISLKYRINPDILKLHIVIEHQESIQIALSKLKCDSPVPLLLLIYQTELLCAACMSASFDLVSAKMAISFL
jgi:hypothetical protein